MRQLGITLTLLVAAACGSSDQTGAVTDARSGSLGILEIERTGAVHEGYARTVLGALFSRYEGVEGVRVLDLLGVGTSSLSIDQCVLAGGQDGAVPEPSAVVELLDAGAIEVDVLGTQTELLPRTFPEIGSLVAGVFYADDTELPAAVADRDEYRVASAGSAELPPFEAWVVAPPEPTGLHIEGAPLTDGFVIARGAAAELSWDAADPRDRIEIQLATGGQLMECVLRDDGFFRLTDSPLTSVEVDDEARLSVRRVRTQPFDVAGVESAWVEIASTRTLVVSVR